MLAGSPGQGNAHRPFRREYHRTGSQLVGTHWSDDDASRGRFYNGASGGHGVSRRPRWGGHDDAVPHDAAHLDLVGPHLHLRHPRHGALEHHSVVQRQVLADNFSPPHYLDIQHHPLLDRKVSLGQRSQQRELGPLQFRHKAHAAHIDPQNRHIVKRGVPGRMEDGTVSSEADQKIRTGQLPLQRGQCQLARHIDPVPLLRDEGQAERRLGTRSF